MYLDNVWFELDLTAHLGQFRAGVGQRHLEYESKSSAFSQA